MADVFDVAHYILTKQGKTTTVKLQKLVYYCQAWSLVWEEEPLFSEPIEAWANGPVVPDLFYAHQGNFFVNSSSLPRGNSGNLTDPQKDTIDSVLKHYGDKTAQWLVDLTHLEDPWRIARGACGRGEPCQNEITQSSMMEYYSGL